MKPGWVLLAAVCLAYPTSALGGDEQEDFGDLDLQQLMEMPVTSVAGVPRRFQDAPAAVFVVTPEDIRRGGHLTIPDVLRTVPGMEVGQIDSSIWAISARGFNDRFSTKLLALVDGRAVYNSLFSGVYWDVQDVVLEDLDRIEVVRGPGATLWGANAVNGVINIVSKSARETQGLLFTAGGGDVHEAFGTVRYGGELGRDVYYRVYGKYQKRDNFEFENPAGLPPTEDWDLGSGGFRIDFESYPDTTVTLQGGAHDGTIAAPVVTRSTTAPFATPQRIDTEASGVHALVRVEHYISERAAWHLRALYDREERERPGFFDEERDTFEIDFRHNCRLGERNDLIWGVAYRHRSDETVGTLTLSMDPADDSKDLYSGFVQDTIELVEDRMSLMVGSKFEENDFTGFELQPSVRFAWTPDERRTLWAAVSRAVRTPSRASENLSVAVGPPAPTPARLIGNPEIDSEQLLAYELGYRFQPLRGLTVDIAGFFNDYTELISIGAPAATPPDVTFSNDTEGETFGVEITARRQVSESWRLSGSYSFLDVSLRGLDVSDEGASPRNQLSLQSYLDLNDDLELNAAVYLVDEVDEGNIDSYARLDLGLTWRPSETVDLAVWGQNLWEGDHVEFVDEFFVISPIEVPRSIYGQLSVRF